MLVLRHHRPTVAFFSCIIILLNPNVNIMKKCFNKHVFFCWFERYLNRNRLRYLPVGAFDGIDSLCMLMVSI
jgi:hypothetical protein